MKRCVLLVILLPLAFLSYVSAQTGRSDGKGRVAGREGILLPRGMGSTKSCVPNPASAGASVQCSFTMQNLDPESPVTQLTVANTIPDPLAPPAAECTTTVPSVTPNIPCFLLDPVTGLPTATQVTTLAPLGTIDPQTGIHTDTCGGIMNETAPPCGSVDCNFSDRVFGSGTDTGVVVNSSTGGFVVVLACTPTPTNTPT